MYCACLRTRLRTRCVAQRKEHRVGRQTASVSKSGVLVVPGYLLDAREFVPLVAQLRADGFNAALAPIRWYNWLPTLGGRSLRPILDRIDYAVKRLASEIDVSEENGFEIQLTKEATWIDAAKEMQNASNGAQPVQEVVTGDVQNRVALVGCSAAGWIARIYLGSGPSYDGRIYHGNQYVHTLVTLGSPHICNEGVTRKNVAFVNESFPGACESDVKYLCLAGRAVQGNSYLGGIIKDFTYQSYELCSSNGKDWGDGVTPVKCAIGLDGAEKLIFEDVWHSPVNGRRWYGSDDVVRQWSHFLHDRM